MTNDESNLAAIEAKLTVVAIGCDSPADVGVNDVRWLIAEVRRMQALITTGKAIIHDIADGSEYRRGREDERAAVVALAVNDYFLRDFARCIERGEHLEEPDAR